MKKTLVLGLSLLTFGATVLPSTLNAVAYADEVSTTDVFVEQNKLQAETIYSDEEGNIFTNNEIIVQKGTTDPRIQPRAIGASPISIGILWTYQNKADATKLRNTFRKVAATDGTLGVISGLLTAAAIPTGGITAVLGTITTGLGAGVNARFNEAADLINTNMNGGKIYMYLDHCTYSK